MSARSTSENCGPSASSRATRSRSTASRALPSWSARPGFTRQRPNLELRRPGRADVPAGRGEELHRFCVPVRLGQSFGPRELRFDPPAEVGRDTAAEERRIDAELPGEPSDRLGGGSRLATLDLADVLLRKAIPANLGLSQTGRRRSERSRSPTREAGANGVVAAGAVAAGGSSSAGDGRAAFICASVNVVHVPVHSPDRVRSGSHARDFPGSRRDFDS